MIISLRQRIGFLFLAFFFLIAISVIATFLAIETQKKDALVINLAGRQRMLLQAMTRHALELEKQPDEGEHRKAMAEAAQVFASTLDALENGGPAPYVLEQVVTLPPTRDPAVRASLQQVRVRWAALQTQLELVLTTPHDDPAFSNAVAAIESQSLPLVQVMDDAVRAFEQVATAKVHRLRIIQVLFLIAAVILVLMGYGLIYRTVICPVRALQAAAEEIGSGQLAKPVPNLGPDEIGQLAQSLEVMRQQLHAVHVDLEAQVAQRTRELEALYEVTREISSRLEISHVLRSVTDKAHELLGGEVAALCLLDQGGRELNLQALSGPERALRESGISAQDPRAAQVLAAEGALSCEHGGCTGHCKILAPPFQASHLAAPLRIGERVIGALCVGSTQMGLFPPDAAALLTKLADSAAIALENARLYEQAERVATLEERQRIAAEMHDGLAQTLSYLGLKLDRIAELVELGQGCEASQELQRARSAIDQAAQEVRRSIASLQGENDLPQSLSERLAEVVREFTANGGPAVKLMVDLEAPLLMPSSHMEQVIRVLQESLANARQHSGASKITARLERVGNQARIIITDNGCGFDPKTVAENGDRHFGLRIMRARAARIGGHIRIESSPGQGTQLTLTWPLNGDVSNRAHLPQADNLACAGALPPSAKRRELSGAHSCASG